MLKEAMYVLFPMIGLSLVGIVLFYTRRHKFPVRTRRVWITLALCLCLTTSLVLSLLRFVPGAMSCGSYYLLLITTLFASQSLGLAYSVSLYYTSQLSKSGVEAFAQRSHHRHNDSFLQEWADQKRFRKIKQRLTDRYILKVLTLVNVICLVIRVLFSLLIKEVYKVNIDSSLCDSYGNYNAIFFALSIPLLIVICVFFWRLRKTKNNLFLTVELVLLGFFVFLSSMATFMFSITYNNLFIFAEYVGRFGICMTMCVVPSVISFRYEPESCICLRSGRFAAEFNHALVDVSSMQKSQRQCLLDVLLSLSGYELFLKFLVQELSSENLLFWKEVNDMFVDWEQISKGNLAWPAEIYHQFVKSDAPFHVNISYEARLKLEYALNVVHADPGYLAELHSAFKLCQKQVEILMFRDSFHRFCLTQEYKDWLITSEEDRLGRFAVTTNL